MLLTVLGLILSVAGFIGWIFLLFAFLFCIKELGEGM
jgi:hypothetical protein